MALVKVVYLTRAQLAHPKGIYGRPVTEVEVEDLPANYRELGQALHDAKWGSADTTHFAVVVGVQK